MNDPIDPAPVSGPLPYIGLLRFTGPDAAGFLQGQVSNDTRRLSTEKPLLAAYSNPQGRVIAVMHLIPHSSGIVALLPRELVLPALERLRKYILRSKVKIEDASAEFAVFGRHLGATRGAHADAAAGLPVLDAERRYAERNGIGVARVGDDAGRCWVVGSAQDIAALPSEPPRLPGEAQLAGKSWGIENDWRLADIRSGTPQVYAATSEQFVAQMLNLDLIDGISFTKGCFTGQEIIARTQHLGRIKRRMFRLRLPGGSWVVGQELQLADGRSGRLTEVARSGAGYEALAVLRTGASTAAAPDGTGPVAESDAVPPDAVIEAVELPLPYSLGPTA